MPSSRMMRRSAASSSSTMIGARPSSGSSSSSTLRIEHQRAADRQHLLLAAGQLVAEIVAALGEARKHARRPASASMPGLRDRGQVLVDGERRKMLRSCGTQPTPACGALVGPQRGDVAAAERDRAGAIAGDADDRVEQRRLAHAVAAEQRQRLPFGKRQRELGQHHGLAVAGARVARCAGASAIEFLAEIDRFDARIACDLVGRALDEQRAVDQHRDAVGEARTRDPCRARSAARSRPPAARRWWQEFVRARASGTPAAGSSSSSTCGRQAKASAISSRRCLP